MVTWLRAVATLSTDVPWPAPWRAAGSAIAAVDAMRASRTRGGPVLSVSESRPMSRSSRSMSAENWSDSEV